jgi:enoyl-CoA hydratase/carnithine racemase
MAGERELGIATLVGRRDPPIGWLVFNNPERLNAVSLEMWQAVRDVLAAFAEDPEIRVVVLAGAGDRAFVSGADISQFGSARASAEANARYDAISSAGRAAIADCPKPTLAMIRGYCIGGGLAVALSCDLRIAAEGSQFAIPAGRLGLGYAYASMATLVSVVGPANAKEIMYTARRFSGEEALQMGLVNRLVPATGLEAEVDACAREIAANAPLTLRAAKLAIDAAAGDPGRRDLTAVQAAVDACFASEDYKEGRQAFQEKRRPDFKGR